MRKIRNIRSVKRGRNLPVRVKRFVNSFRPSQFRAYWLNKEGLRRLGKIAASGLLLVFLLVLFVAKDLPSPGKINARLGAQTTKFYDRTGETVLYEVFGNKNRNVIKLEAIPDNVKQATIAIEDKDFYEHGAFSVQGILRATYVNIFRRDGGIQGGSTITQQYVKNALLSPERTFSRKIREVILSVIIEQFYRKDDILALYLNEIPYGSNAYGIKAASNTYFEKDNPLDLTLDEAAMLAAIPRAPTYYSPYGQHKDQLIARQHLILDLMAEQKYITKEQAEEAKRVDTLAKVPPTQNLYANIIAPHFVLYVQEQLEAEFGTKIVTEGGLKVITTLDVDKYNAAVRAINRNIGRVRANRGSNSALVATDPNTGEMLAMVGSHNFSDPENGAFNVAIANRQPGSSFKPFAYATAFSKNYGPGTTLYDVNTDFGGGYKPENFTDITYGVQSMRSALAGSLNISAVKTLYLAGVSDTIVTARKMGIKSLKNDPNQYGLSLVLGSAEVKVVEMANAYESFANGGFHHEQVTVLKVTDPKGKVIKEHKPKKPQKVLDPQVAYLINHVLSDNGARAFIFGGRNSLVLPGRTASAKTGTSENYRDAWTVGYTPDLVAAVWSGNNDDTPMTRAASAISAPIWHDFMVEALKDTPNKEFDRPRGIKTVALDAHTGRLPSPGAKETRTDIFPSWYKPTPFNETRSAEIDKVSGKLATECTPPLAKETVYEAEIHAEIPSRDPAFNRWEAPVQALARSLGYNNGGSLPTEKDDVHSCGDSKPNVNLTVTNLGAGNVRIRSVVTSGKFTANKLEIFLDDQIISTQAISGNTTYEFIHKIANNGGYGIKSVVTDQGLYQDTDEDNITIADAGKFEGTAPLDGAHDSGNITFVWTDLSGATQYRLYYKRGDGAYSSVTSSDNEEDVTLVIPGTYRWYAEAYAGTTLLAKSSELVLLVP